MANTLKIATTYLKGKGKLRLQKKFMADGTKESYPMAKNFTSETHDYPLTVEGFDQRLADMKQKALEGWCMLKGELDQQLEEEPRAGHTLVQKHNNVLMLDIDGMQVNLAEVVGWDKALELDREQLGKKESKLGFIDTGANKLGEYQIKALAHHVIQKLPPELHNVSYFIHASSSMGIDTKAVVSMHIEFILDKPIAPKKMKDWLLMQNLTNETFSQKLSLNATGMGLRYPLDISVADNSKLIFIANPFFQDPDQNPIQANHRILLVKRKRLLVDTNEMIFPMSSSQLEGLRGKAIQELRRSVGLGTKKLQTTMISVSASAKERLLKNPDQMDFEIVDDSGDFVHANVNGGDSNAYYWPKNDPTLVFNFKDEPVFRLEDANKEFYEEMTARYADEIAAKKGFRCIVGRDEEQGGQLIAIIADTSTSIVSELLEMKDRGALEDWANENGGFVPESLPMIRKIYEPSETKQIEQRLNKTEKGVTTIVNMYKESDNWRKAHQLQKEEINYENGAQKLERLCPNTHKLLRHVLAGEVEFSHFLNWLACATKEKRKLGTVWLMQGTQGTGKGIMFEHVIKPLFGNSNSRQITLDALEDKYNAFLETSTFICVDEFSHQDAQNKGRLEGILKMMATEGHHDVRGMHQEYRQASLRFNSVFFTNKKGGLRLEDGDRRWHVAPRQETKLSDIFPKGLADIPNFIEALKEEQEAFACYLYTYQEDLPKAIQMINGSEAKKAVAHASESDVKTLIRALEQGNLRHLINMLLDEKEPQLASEMKKTIGHIKMHSTLQPNEKIYIATKDLTCFFSAATENDVTPKKLAKIIERHSQRGFERTDNMKSVYKDYPSRQRGYAIYMNATIDDANIADELLGSNAQKVRSIK